MPRTEPEPKTDPNLIAILERLAKGGAMTVSEEQIYGKHSAVEAMLVKMGKPKRGEVVIPVGMVQPSDGGHKADMVEGASEFLDGLGLTTDKARKKFVEMLEEENEKDKKKK